MYTTCSYISLIAQANVLSHTYSVSRLLHKQTQNYTRVCIPADPNFALYELESSELNTWPLNSSAILPVEFDSIPLIHSCSGDWLCSVLSGPLL